MKALLAIFLGTFVATPLSADVLTVAPDKPDTTRTYLFYLHGRIIETSGPRPVSPDYGVYEYAAILDTLGRDGVVVISAQRPPNTDVHEYAGVVVGQIERLIAAGVPAVNISVVGFSKGGDIALHVSSFLRRPDVHYVILAGCSELLATAPNIQPTGHLLSIREKNDTIATSCSVLGKRLSDLVEYREIELQTGKGHGEFYVPRPEWLEPTLSFLNHRTG